LNKLIALPFLLLPLAHSKLFANPFFTTKWALLYGFALIYGLILLFKGINLPKIGKKEAIVLSSFAGLSALSMLINHTGFYEKVLLDISCGLIIALFGYKFFDKKDPKILKYIHNSASLSAAIILFQRIFFLYGVDFMKILYKLPGRESFTGNPKLTSQSLGFLIAFQIGTIKHARFKYLSYILIGSEAIYLLSTRGKASIFALTFYAMAFLLLRYKPFDIARKIGARVLVAFLIVGALGIGFNLSKIYNSQTQSFDKVELIKTDLNYLRSFYDRVNLLYSSLLLIKDHPVVGVGPSRFADSFPPYQAKLIHNFSETQMWYANNPHNGYLEIIAEYGFPAGLLFLFSLMFFSRKTFENLSSLKDDQLLKFLWPITWYFSIEALFHFPMERAFPFFIFCILLGIALHYYIEKDKPVVIAAKYGAIPMLLVIVGISFYSTQFYRSYHMFLKHFKDPKKLEVACRIFPSNWKVCGHSADMSLQKKDLRTAIQKYHKNLESMPNHLPTLAGIAHAYGFIRKYKESCIYFNKYQVLLRNWKSKYWKKHKYSCQRARIRDNLPN
jgi:O-antigen ligase